jgi:hypothetical protein
MHRQVLVFPLLPGKSDDDARGIADGFRERPQEYTESRRRLVVSLERAYLQSTPIGSFDVAHTESERPFDAFVADTAKSELPIDRFFVDTVRELHGFDLTQPPPGPASETIGAWFDPAVTTRGRGMAFVAPLLPGTEHAALAFIADAFSREDRTRPRRAWYQSAEVVTITATPSGEVAAVYLEGEDPFAGNVASAASSDPFDTWFKAELAKLFPAFIDVFQAVPGVTEIFDSAALPAGA